jgi:hypothetical protein
MVFKRASTPMDEAYLNIGLHMEIFHKVSEVVDRILFQFLPKYVGRGFLSPFLQRQQSHFMSVPDRNS